MQHEFEIFNDDFDNIFNECDVAIDEIDPTFLNSEHCKLDTIYTNHSLRVTACTIIGDIAFRSAGTKHKVCPPLVFTGG